VFGDGKRISGCPTKKKRRGGRKRDRETQRSEERDESKKPVEKKPGHLILERYRGGVKEVAGAGGPCCGDRKLRRVLDGGDLRTPDEGKKAGERKKVHYKKTGAGDYRTDGRDLRTRKSTGEKAKTVCGSPPRTTQRPKKPVGKSKASKSE